MEQDLDMVDIYYFDVMDGHIQCYNHNCKKYPYFILLLADVVLQLIDFLLHCSHLKS